MEASWIVWTACSCQPLPPMVTRCSPLGASMVSDPRRVAILGSTGSIGRQALDVVRDYPDRFQVVALCAGSDSEPLRQQVEEFQPALVAVSELRDATWSTTGHVLSGQTALNDVAAEADADIVLVAT